MRALIYFLYSSLYINQSILEIKKSLKINTCQNMDHSCLEITVSTVMKDWHVTICMQSIFYRVTYCKECCWLLRCEKFIMKWPQSCLTLLTNHCFTMDKQPFILRSSTNQLHISCRVVIRRQLKAKMTVSDALWATSRLREHSLLYVIKQKLPQI